MLARREDSVLVIVDMQPAFLKAIHETERVLRRSRFILEVALLLSIPVLATEQYASRMGGTEDSLRSPLHEHGVQILSKMSFSCAGSDSFMEALENTGRKQVVIVGIETHICVNQTAHHLAREGYEVIVCADATGSRFKDMYDVGVTRLASAGITMAHTESIVYEWLKSAEDPAFRDALKLVKSYA